MLLVGPEIWSGVLCIFVAIVTCLANVIKVFVVGLLYGVVLFHLLGTVMCRLTLKTLTDLESVHNGENEEDSLFLMCRIS